MSIGQGSTNVEQRRLAIPGPPFGVGAALNGLSVDALGRIVLGQDFNQAGDPAAFISNREENMAGFAFRMRTTNGNRFFLLDIAADQYAWGDIDGNTSGMRTFIDGGTNRYFISNAAENFFNVDAVNRTSVWSLNATAINLDETNKQIGIQTDTINGGIRGFFDDTATDPLLNVARALGNGHLGVTNQAASTTYNNLFAGGAGWTAQIVHAGNNFGLVTVRASNDTGGANVALYKTRSAQAGTKVAAVAGDGVGNITWQGVSTNLTVSDCVSQRVNVVTVNAASIDANWILQTRAAGSGITERIRVDDAGSFHVGAAANNSASAILQADSTTQGFLMPRMTTAQKNAIAAPATGLMVFDTTLAKLAVFTGAAWETVTSV